MGARAPAPPPPAPTPERRQVVRHKQPPDLIASPIRDPGLITLPDGSRLDARPGDIRISRGPLTLTVLSPERFATEYEVVEPLALHLTAAECNQLDEILGIAATRDAASLIRACDRLGAIRIGDIRIPFTPGQLVELQHRAEKRGRTVEAELKAVVARIEDELFFRGA